LEIFIMSTDKQFEATGPAAVGFETHGTNIVTGAVLQGNKIGAWIEGQSEGARVICHAGNALIASSAGGRAGTFISISDLAQISLEPKGNTGRGGKIPVHPEAYTTDEKGVNLPVNGVPGDLLATTVLGTTSLFLCVSSAAPNGPAVWREVLLGPNQIGRV
jgi:hypothetical protein